MNKTKYIISPERSVRDALSALNNLRSQSMTLFVVDGDNKMLGTLTDGDIRRGIVQGKDLEAPVTTVMHTNFSYVNSLTEVGKIKYFRNRNIHLIPVVDNEFHLVDLVDLIACKSALPIDAVLMAGGKGERLRPLTLETPKPLLMMGTKPIIDHNVDSLINHGVNNIFVTVNYLKEQLIKHYDTPVKNNVQVECIEEEKFFGTIGALTLIHDFKNDTILVMNSDLLTDIDYEDFYLHFTEHDAMMSVAAIPYTISIPYGILDLNGRNINGVTEKPTYNLYANAGIYLIKKEALKYIPKNEVFNATDLIEALVADGQNVIRYPLSSLWIDIGTPDEYRKAKDLVKHLK